MRPRPDRVRFALALAVLLLLAAAPAVRAQTTYNQYTCSSFCNGGEDCTNVNSGLNLWQTCRHVSTNSLTATVDNIYSFDGIFHITTSYVRGDCTNPHGRVRIQATFNGTYDVREVYLAVFDSGGGLLFGSQGTPFCTNCSNLDYTTPPLTGEPAFVTVFAQEFKNYPGGCISNCLPWKQIRIGQGLPGCPSCYGCCANGGLCNDGDFCTIDSCDPSQGGCVHQPNTNAPCDDGKPCSVGEYCHANGNCKADPPNDNTCDDGNPCTNDTCTVNGCQFANNTANCTPDVCHTGSKCKGGTCGNPISCDDSNVCTADACAVPGGCYHTGLTGPACDDNNVCTPTDTCQNGVCRGSGTINCDDGKECTTDGCAVSTGCYHICAQGSGCPICGSPANWCAGTSTACGCAAVKVCNGGPLAISTYFGSEHAEVQADGTVRSKAGGITTAMRHHIEPRGNDGSLPYALVVAIRSDANGRYWTWTAGGQVRANATSVGPNQTFYLRYPEHEIDPNFFYLTIRPSGGGFQYVGVQTPGGPVVAGVDNPSSGEPNLVTECQ
jgi:hypothetical protein